MKSKFRDWQESRKEISYKEFAEKYPNSARFIASEDFHVERIFVYRDGTWIVKRSYNKSWPHFLAYISNEFHSSEDMEMIEMRQYLYQYDREE